MSVLADIVNLGKKKKKKKLFLSFIFGHDLIIFKWKPANVKLNGTNQDSSQKPGAIYNTIFSLTNHSVVFINYGARHHQ